MARTDIMAMCRKWLAYLIEAMRIALGIPATEFTELGNLYNEVERTHVITVECQAAFKVLTMKMRFFRDRYFEIPPLTEGDWAALGFKAKDPHRLRMEFPRCPSAIRQSLCHDHPSGLMAGTQELAVESDYGYAIYVGIMQPGGDAGAGHIREALPDEAASGWEGPFALLLYAAAEGEARFRRGRRRDDGLRLLLVREPERRNRAMGTDSCRRHSVGMTLNMFTAASRLFRWKGLPDAP